MTLTPQFQSPQFADPASASGVAWSDLQGKLLMFEVLGVEEHVPTVHTRPGEKNPAVRANLQVLDGGGETYDDTLVFPKVLQSQLRSKVGQLVLGRLGQGAAKPGQSAPWKLEPATASDRQTAEEHLRRGAAPAVSSSEAPF